MNSRIRRLEIIEHFADCASGAASGVFEQQFPQIDPHTGENMALGDDPRRSVLVKKVVGPVPEVQFHKPEGVLSKASNPASFKANR